ncbi:alpha/beta fold hydrolase [Gordonia shandongensis]|uniref:alpha/beta fold hydrolase n=1 Tax=Gordonia shandongensis TaxID=376351 RepID=UPI00047B6BE9|nr:alpha/beta fold hydrolase [Gordonia shandongensis]
MRRTAAVIACVACVVTGGTVAAGVVSPGAASAAPEALRWGACDPVHQASPQSRCATIRVPRDYADPKGPTISLTVSRLPARDPGGRRGVLMGNPGGPGGDGIGMFTAVPMPSEVRDHWDQVAVQPRGLVGSTPVRCDPVSFSPDMLTRLGAVNRQRCEQNTPGYTRTITTENTARDMDRVRQALGQERVSLYGLSYGTWLMSTYATLFPQHTDRLILDSAMDPARAWGELLQDQTAGYKARTHAMMAWIARNDDVYHLGRTPLAVYRVWSRKVSQEAGVPPSLLAPPARVGDVPPGLRAVAEQYIAGADLTADARARIENVIATLVTGRVQASSSLLVNTRAAAPNRNAWPYVAQMMTGKLRQPKPSKAVVNLAETGQNMQSVMICNEDWAPHDPLLTPAAYIQNYLTGDIFEAPGLLFASGLGCSGAAPVGARVPISGDRLRVRPLQIQSVGDPQTPYRWSMATRRSMGAHLITVGSGDHGQLGRGNATVDAAVARYLRTGRTATTKAPQGPISTPLLGSGRR